MTAPLLDERRGAVSLMLLNRPEVGNAVDLPMAEAIADALERLDADPELRVGVLAGAGGGFCSGMDMKAFARTGQWPFAGDRGFAGIARRSARKPLIAAVEGYAIAGGLEIALACDIIVASRGAKLGLPEVKRGLVAAGGGLVRLARRLPAGIAAEMALSGDPITAERAHELGAVNRLAEPGRALELALELAGQVAANGPLAVAASKQILTRQRSWSEEEVFDRQDELARPVLESEDAAEGVRAYNEKRPPRWRSR